MTNKNNLDEIKNLARRGDLKAQYELALLYKTGNKVEKNLENYKKWLEEAAKNGNSEAMNELGDCYASGIAVDADEMAAVSWYKSAIEKGNISASHKLATILITGLINSDESSLHEDMSKAEKLLRKAANEDFVESQYQLGLFYQMDVKGLTKDFEEAKRWLEKAAEKDHTDAQNALAYLFAYGSIDGKIKINKEDAMKWWSKAAKKNHAEAQYNLGVSFAKLAVENWKSSARTGDEKSIYMLNQIAGYEWDDK